jgi:NitT/TauT family transport system permease protein/sulfonate transport system permease protein
MPATPAVPAPARPPRVGVWTAHVLSIAFLLGWAAAARMLPDYLLPGPVAVAAQILRLLMSPAFLLDALYSILHIAGSIAVAFIFGLAFALLMHFVPVVRTAINDRLNPFLSSFSTIGWVFLAVIWFGLNDFTVVFVVAMTLMPFALSNLRAALQELDHEVIEMARSFGRVRTRHVRLMLLPLMVPYLFATLRICLGVAWKVVLTAELFGGTSGFGHVISRARADFDAPTLFAIIVIIVVLVYVTDKFALEPINLRMRRNYVVA